MWPLSRVCGLIKPMSGTVHFEGVDITKAKPYERVNAGIAYVPQGRGGFPQLTVKESLTVVQEASRRATASSIDEMLDMFPRLVPLLGRRSGFLSGGSFLTNRPKEFSPR